MQGLRIIDGARDLGILECIEDDIPVLTEHGILSPYALMTRFD